MANDKNDKADKNEKVDKSEKKESSQLTDTIRKIITAGSPTDISKELIGTILGQALKAKDDVASKVTNEMIALVRKIDFVTEFSKFAQNHKFRVTAEIEITKKGETADDIKTEIEKK